jgi:hypothetical protein
LIASSWTLVVFAFATACGAGPFLGAATASDEAASVGSTKARQAATAYRVVFFTGFLPS